MEFRNLPVDSILRGELIPEASVHGRFQPLHNAHLEYLIEAKRRCRFLWVGITKFDVDHLNPLGRPRERPEANPLTYFERIQIIKEGLSESGIPPEEFRFLPFPIENPNALPRFLPTTIPCFTTICEDWNREKVRLLEKCGYRVLVLWEREPKEITGSFVREDIARGGTRWIDLVPPATVKAVERLNLTERLRNLFKISEK